MRNQMYKTITVLVLVSFVLTGCYTAEYKVDSYNAPPGGLSAARTAYVAIPEDGRYGDEVYTGSGTETALAILAEVSKHGRGVLAKSYQTHNTDLTDAKTAGAAYLFEPLILHWEHRATEWSGLPNRITLRIEVYDTATNKVISDSVLEAHSSWWTLGGDHPEDLLSKPLGPFVDRVYRDNP
jgi:hypothetical protein